MITAKEVRTWMASLEAYGKPLKIKQVAYLLGYTAEAMSRWRSEGVDGRNEKAVRLAMAALSAGLEPWRGER